MAAHSRGSVRPYQSMPPQTSCRRAARRWLAWGGADSFALASCSVGRAARRRLGRSTLESAPSKEIRAPRRSGRASPSSSSMLTRALERQCASHRPGLAAKPPSCSGGVPIGAPRSGTETSVPASSAMSAGASVQIQPGASCRTARVHRRIGTRVHNGKLLQHVRVELRVTDPIHACVDRSHRQRRWRRKNAPTGRKATNDESRARRISRYVTTRRAPFRVGWRRDA